MERMLTRRRVVQGSVAVGAAITFGIGLRLDAPAFGARVLSPEEISVVRAVVEVLFPGPPMPLSGVDAGVVEEVDRLAEELLEEPNVSAFRVILRALEWGTLAAQGMRFSQLSIEERTVVIDTWSDPEVLPRRASIDYLRFILGMAYFNHPEIRKFIGAPTVCGGPA